MKTHLLVIILLSLTTPIMADDTRTVTFLAPINVPTPVAGAYGTVWKSELWIHNGLARQLAFAPCTGVVGDLCVGSPQHKPGTTQQAFAEEVTLSRSGALLLYASLTAAEATDSIVLSSRLFELSRHTQPAGVQMPVVREDRFVTRPALFIGISGSASNRVAVRVYDPRIYNNRPAEGNLVRIEVLGSQGAAIAETTLQLQYPGRIWEPGYAAITDLRSVFPQLANIERYDVRVTPLTTDLQYWAMVSVTDTETQQVLLITAD
jgi:hypothetical protein